MSEQTCHIIVLQREPSELKRIKEYYRREIRGANGTEVHYVQSPQDALEKFQCVLEHERVMLITGMYFGDGVQKGDELINTVMSAKPDSLCIIFSINAPRLGSHPWISRFYPPNSYEQIAKLMAGMSPEATLLTLKERVESLVLPRTDVQPANTALREDRA